MSIGTLYLESAVKRFRSYKELADQTFRQLKPEEMHYRPGSESNSIAQVIQHMSGNMLSRWTDFLTSDGEKPWRERDAEFGVNAQSYDQLIECWEKGWACLFNALATLKDADLEKTILIRQEKLIVIDAINRQLTHYPYHVGQIVYLGKCIRNENWQSLSIPRGESVAFNDKLKNLQVK